MNIKNVVLSLALLLIAQTAYAFTDDEAIRAIIGEDATENGQVAVAHAIRNRGTLTGVYGLRAVKWSGNGLKRYKKGIVVESITPETWQRASKAWFESAYMPDVTKGADHWEGVKFKKPYWTKGMADCGVFGENRFYRGSK